MTIALVQSAVGTLTSGTSYTVTLGSAPKPRSLLVLIGTTPVDVTGVSGGGVTWQQDDSPNTFMWHGENSSGSGSVITVTLSASSNACGIVAEFSGVQTLNSLDGFSVITSPTTSADAASNAFTTSFPYELLIGWFRTTTSGITFSAPTNGFTIVNTVTDGVNRSAVLMSNIVAVTGNYSAGVHLSASVLWTGQVAAFKGFIPDEDYYLPPMIQDIPTVRQIWR